MRDNRDRVRKISRGLENHPVCIFGEMKGCSGTGIGRGFWLRCCSQDGRAEGSSSSR